MITLLGLDECEAVLFDLDGVLVDSFEAWFSAYNDTLRKFGKDELDRKKFREDYWGLGLDDIMRSLGLGKKASRRCLSSYNDRVDKVVLLPKARETLETIDDRKGLVTNTPKSPTEKILKNFDLDQHFDAVVSADEVDQGKPAPDPVLEVCERMEVDPGETILIGDSESDMNACQKAGCRPVGIGSGPDRKFESIEDLYHELKGVRNGALNP